MPKRKTARTRKKSSPNKKQRELYLGPFKLDEKTKQGLRALNNSIGRLFIPLVLLTLSSCATIPYDSNNPILKYNYMENIYSYEDPATALRYNYMEKRWEWAR